MMGNLATLARRSRRPLARLRARPHRRGRGRAATVAVALQPAAPPRSAEELRVAGQRGDGRGVRAGRLHHRGHEPRPGVPGRRGDEHAATTASSTGRRRATSARLRVPRHPGRRAARERSCSRSCRRRCSTWSREQLPRAREHGRAHDHLEHLRQPRGVDPGRARSTGCPSGMQVLARAPCRRHCCSTSRSPLEREMPWPLVAT